MCFDVKAPAKSCNLVLQAWDRDIFTRNDYICEWTLDLNKILQLVQMNQQIVTLNEKFYK